MYESSLKNRRGTYTVIIQPGEPGWIAEEEMLGHNVQVYVDDKVVTSEKEDQHVTDLEDLFATIARYNLKLNPGKCVFAVEAWKFLDFLLTERGI